MSSRTIRRRSTKARPGPTSVGRMDVRYVLEGSIQRDGDQIRVTAQLIDVKSNAHLWSERWDRPAKEFFAVQTDIADQLANRLGGVGVVDRAEQEAARRSRPGNLTAYELYLAGRSEFLRLTPDGTTKAIELFERAVAADPRLARAWTDLAGAQRTSVNYGADAAIAYPAAASAARRAIEIDPSDALAHAVLGMVLGLQGEFGPAEAEYDTALRSIQEMQRSWLRMQAGWCLSVTQNARQSLPTGPSGSIRIIMFGTHTTFPMRTSVSVDTKTRFASWRGCRRTNTSTIRGFFAPRATPGSASPRRRRRPHPRR